MKTYQRQVKKDSNRLMVELKTLDSSFVYDIRYATPNNFTNTVFYPSGSQTYVRKPAALALLKVQRVLQEQGYGLKIFDAYRPYHVTKKMWDLIGDERYVANPAKGSGHNRGLAIDLTIIELATGKEVDMGTGYDHFSDTAHHSFTQLPEQILKNRKWLRSIMENAGFIALPTEWWHYNWPNDRGYELLDLPFQKFRKDD